MNLKFILIVSIKNNFIKITIPATKMWVSTYTNSVIHANSAQLCFNTVKYYSNIIKKRFLWLTFLQLENITKVLIKVLRKLFFYNSYQGSLKSTKRDKQITIVIFWKAKTVIKIIKHESINPDLACFEFGA